MFTMLYKWNNIVIVTRLKRERIACNMNLLIHTHTHVHTYMVYIMHYSDREKIKFYHKLIFITLQVEGVSE